MSQGQTGFIPGTNRVCPWDIPGVVPRATGPKSLCLYAATRATIYRSLRALRARNPKEVSKRVFLGVCKKVPENTRKSRKTPPKCLILVFFDFFGYFRGLFCRPPKRLFLRLFGDFGPRGPGDSCKWLLGSQLMCLYLA